MDIKEITRLLPGATKEEWALIQKASDFANEAHRDHKRKSGEPYFVHLFETAKILADLGMGATTIAGGFLHDTIEDAGITKEQLENEFGEQITFLVEGVTKLGKLRYQGADRHNESLRKLFVAMSQDIRVLIIKLADRLHNMRTLKFIPEEKQRRIATETLEIYAPIAYRLGIRKLNRELEDLAFPYVYPNEHKEMQKMLKQKHDESVETLEKFLRSLKKALAKEGIVKVKTEYRVKGSYSLYKKLLRKDKQLEKVHDIAAVRVILPEVSDCYRVLGIIHSIWRPLPGRIKDYIAFPKPNGYKGLHTTVFTGDGNIIEVQIKTENMHRESEYGITAHISYKEGASSNDQNMKWIRALLPVKKDSGENSPKNKIGQVSMDDVPGWIKELVEYQHTISDHSELHEDLKTDFFGQRIFVFSPKGDVVDLPTSSTPVDFAYSIHSDIGNHMVGAKVNGKLVSLDTPLHNGDIVLIMTKDKATPNAKWTENAKTGMAKRHIRSALQKLKKMGK